MSGQAALTSTEYIQHHLLHWQYSFVTHQMGPTTSFLSINLDTILVSWVLGILFIGSFYLAARRCIAGVPGKFQNFVELCMELIDGLVRETFSASEKLKPQRLIAPMAMTIFLWVFLMNFMDLIPVDAFPRLASALGVHHFKVVPTADPNLTFAMSLSIFFLVIFFNISAKKTHLLSEMCSKPFGWWLLPVNIMFRLIEEFSKPLSLALRLFGNLFAGELVFILIAALLPWWTQWLPGMGWSVLHILIITVQSFVFMMLTVVYLSLAQQAH